MDEACFERLASNADAPEELFEHFETATFDGRTYHPLPSGRHGVERGTVVIPAVDEESADSGGGSVRASADDAAVIVRGYPSVPRVLVVDPGLPAFFEDDDRVVVEEKLDGYNVRVARVDGRAWAFTRSGYACPYATWRARERLDLEGFFDDHPDLCLCAELIGTETPYTTHDYETVDGDALRVFDLRQRETGDPLPYRVRREHCETYGFPTPRTFGVHDPADAPGVVVDAIADLDASGREGVVAKATERDAMVKYTTEREHHAELAHAFSLPFEYGRDFVFSRVAREAFQAVEFDEDDDRLRERSHSLGEAILEPMVETIRAVDAGEPVGEHKTVRGDPEVLDALLAHLRDQSITLDVRRDETTDDERVVEFLKRSAATRDQIGYYLAGGTWSN